MAESNTMKEVLTIPSAVVDSTIHELKQDGSRFAEGIVLWLGRRIEGDIAIVEAYVPIHESESHRFYIPPEGMEALMAKLVETGTFVAAQVHSHPEEAFHSDADDEWAIVRHEGAISVVLPHFASRVTIDSFLSDAAVFKLSATNEWKPVSAHSVLQLR